MTKSEIKLIFDKVGLKKIPPHLKIYGSYGKWHLKDKRTKKRNGLYMVYPIGANAREFYVVNPLNGNLEIHGLTDCDYTGHRSQGYFIKDLRNRKRPNQADRDLMIKIAKLQFFKVRRRLKDEEKKSRI